MHCSCTFRPSVAIRSPSSYFTGHVSWRHEPKAGHMASNLSPPGPREFAEALASSWRALAAVACSQALRPLLCQSRGLVPYAQRGWAGQIQALCRQLPAVLFSRCAECCSQRMARWLWRQLWSWGSGWAPRSKWAALAFCQEPLAPHLNLRNLRVQARSSRARGMVASWLHGGPSESSHQSCRARPPADAEDPGGLQDSQSCRALQSFELNSWCARLRVALLWTCQERSYTSAFFDLLQQNGLFLKTPLHAALPV